MISNNHDNLAINLTNIVFKYPGSNNNIIDNLSLQFQSKSQIGIIAPDGSGKTTLLHIIMGLLKPDAGKIEIFGKQIKTKKDYEDIRRKIGLVFQDADDQLFCPTVIEDIAFGPLNFGKSREQAKKIAHDTLDILGLRGFESKITYKLSGGEKKLIALATVLAMQPEILLLDEPSAGLDEKTKEKLISVLSNIDTSYILISHEHDFLYKLTDSIYTIKKGKILVAGKIHKHAHIHPHLSH